MSFSSDVKNELARIMPEKLCCAKAELSALLVVNGSVVKKGDGSILLQAITENAATARKIFKLIKEIYGLQSSIRIENQKKLKKSRVYEVNTVIEKNDYQVLQELDVADEIAENQVQVKTSANWDLLGRKCCKRAYLRGIFLSRGFINRPQGNYHLEILLNNWRLAADVQKILSKLGLQVRHIVRKKKEVLYIKESEKIADFLRVVGASRALLEFENVRIIKSMRNSVNRQVNCETANLDKTVKASMRQIELIEKLISKKGLDSLSPQVRELALLRIEYPDFTLKELGAMLVPPLSKSGVAYRMRKLEFLAEKFLRED